MSTWLPRRMLFMAIVAFLDTQPVFIEPRGEIATFHLDFPCSPVQPLGHMIPLDASGSGRSVAVGAKGS